VGRGWLIDSYGYLASPADPSAPLSWRETSHNVLLTEHHYDSHGNVIYSKEGGVARTLGYDSMSLHPTTESVSPDNGATVLRWAMSWDYAFGLPKTMTDPNNVPTTVDYDGLGRYVGAHVGSSPQHVRYVYDWAAPMPRTTTYVYDGELSTIPSTDPTQDWANAANWRQTTLVANGAGEDLFSATRLATSRWIVSDWKQRDARGKVVLHGDPFYWDGSDPRSATPVSDFHYQTLKYDALGRLSEQDLPNGGVKAVAYKAFEQTVTASELEPVRSVLDGQGRILHTERKVSGILEEVDALYNAAGQITSMKLQKGTAVHQFLYDTLGRLVWAKDPDIGTREMRYADAGFLIRHKNGASDVLAFFYDHAGRLTGRGARTASSFTDTSADAFASPVAGDYVYHYDTPASEVSACSAPATKGRLAAVDEPAGKAPGVGRVAFCYDQLGRQQVMYRSIGGASGKTGWQVDVLAASGLPLGSRTDDDFRLLPQYDRAGRLQSLADGSGSITQPSPIWQAGLGSSPDSYAGMDAAGRVLGEMFGNNLHGAYTRDEIGLTKTLALQKGQSSPLFGLGITRNKYGAPTIVTDSVATGLDQNAQYVYDGAARMRNATLGATGAAQWRFRYQYNGLQNMIGRTQEGPNATDDIGVLAGDYYYGESGQGPRQLSRILDKDCGGAATTFLYDGAGRMTRETGAKGSKTLTYDGYDQLLNVSLPGGGNLSAAYGYDGLRTYSNGKEGEQYWFTAAYTLAPTGQRWHYVSVGDRLVARLAFADKTSDLRTVLGAAGAVRDFTIRASRYAPLIFVLFLSGATLILLVFGLWQRPRWQAVPATLACYTLLLAMSGCDTNNIDKSQKSLEVDGSRLYFHQGMAAGPTLITDKDGGIREERRFEPFGQPINGTLNKTVDPTNNLNKETNPDTGWSYHGARWMSPQTARWTAPDPAVKGPDKKFMGEPWGLNPYGYASRNPAVYWDPDGLQEQIMSSMNQAKPAQQQTAFFFYRNPTENKAMPVEVKIPGSNKPESMTWRLTEGNRGAFESALKAALARRLGVSADRIGVALVEPGTLQKAAEQNKGDGYTTVGLIAHGHERFSEMQGITTAAFAKARDTLTNGKAPAKQYHIGCFTLQNGFSARASGETNGDVYGVYSSEKLQINFSVHFKNGIQRSENAQPVIESVTLPPTRQVELMDTLTATGR
jgi:RHS repeat-associated protein